MILAGIVGYLPYSDRPGPGWYGPHLPSWSEVSFYLGFAVYFAYYFVFWAPLLFVFARLLNWSGAPRWLFRTLAGLASGVLCLVLAAAAGWYVAISAFAVDVAGILGIFYGVVSMVWCTPEARPDRSAALRWIVAPVLFVVFLGALAYQLLPAKDAQSMDINVLTVEPGSQSIRDDARHLGLTDTQITFLESSGLHGKLRQSSQFSQSIGNTSKHAKAIVVFTTPGRDVVHFQSPKATTVLYLQTERQWVKFPNDAALLKKTFTLTSNADGGVGIQIE